MRVLVIDDDEVNRKVLEKLFLRRGITVAQAAAGAEGIEAARHTRPDLILLDIFLPEEDGFEILGRLKADPVLGPIPVCIFSILDREESKKKALDLGACDYITKPFDMRETVDRVQEILRHGPVLSRG